MTTQAEVNAGKFEIEADQHCLWCGADRSHLTHAGASDEWVDEMRCQMIHCDACDNEFGVSCDIILEDGTLLHDHSEAEMEAWWNSSAANAPVSASATTQEALF